MRLIAKERCYYGRELVAGEEFEATETDGTFLIHIGRAIAKHESGDDLAAKEKRHYKTRAMRAE